jgi:hypothetical protein
MKKVIIGAVLAGSIIFAALAYANTKDENTVGNETKISENKGPTLVSAANTDYLGKVKTEIAEDEAKIARKQRELDAELEEDRIKYRNKPGKLAEKENEYKEELAELDFDRKELQFDKDNIDLLSKIEEKRYQIHLEKRKGNADWDIIGNLVKERDALEEEYERKKADYLY